MDVRFRKNCCPNTTQECGFGNAAHGFHLSHIHAFRSSFPKFVKIIEEDHSFRNIGIVFSE